MRRKLLRVALGGRKGAYVINVVDEDAVPTPWSRPAITQQFMVPVLKDLISAFPFTVRAFHTDNGSEYVNREVADLLRLHIPTFTKSRPRRSNDNALVESKNGSIVRRVPHDLVPQVDAFLRDSLCPLLNFHRPCLFPTRSPAPAAASEDLQERHTLGLAGTEDFLRPGVTFEALDQLASRRRQGRATRPRCPLPCHRPRDSAGPLRRPQAQASPVSARMGGG